MTALSTISRYSVQRLSNNNKLKEAEVPHRASAVLLSLLSSSDTYLSFFSARSISIWAHSVSVIRVLT